MVFQVGREDIFRFPPRSTIVAFTSGVGATGEKIRREPDERRTRVARPPTFILPNRENGKERVVRFGERAYYHDLCGVGWDVFRCHGWGSGGEMSCDNMKASRDDVVEPGGRRIMGIAYLCVLYLCRDRGWLLHDS